MAERREHPRYELACPLKLSTDGGKVLLRTRTGNLSDGGAYFALDLDEALPVGTKTGVEIVLPRTTPNTRMLEHVVAEADVVWCRPDRAEGRATVGIRFAKPLDLMIEV